MLCFALLTRCRVIRPHVEDQLPHELHEQVTLMQGPLRSEKNYDNGIPVSLRELLLSWLPAGIKSISPLSENEGCQNTDIMRLFTDCVHVKEFLPSTQFKQER